MSETAAVLGAEVQLQATCGIKWYLWTVWFFKLNLNFSNLVGHPLNIIFIHWKSHTWSSQQD